MLHPKLRHFIEKEILPLTEIDAGQLWDAINLLIDDFSAGTKTLLSQRQDLQIKIDLWHQTHRTFDEKDYKKFLESIGYLETEGADFSICTKNVDEEIALLSGPQLVVPLKNARLQLMRQTLAGAVSTMLCTGVILLSTMKIEIWCLATVDFEVKKLSPMHAPS